jgi:hypothetical protein
MATQHSFTIGNTSYSDWNSARRAAASTKGIVTVVRDDGRQYTFGRTAAPLETAAAKLVREHRAQQQASTQAVQPAQADVLAQLLAAVTKLNAVVDAQNSRLEALETKRAARKS